MVRLVGVLVHPRGNLGSGTQSVRQTPMMCECKGQLGGLVFAQVHEALDHVLTTAFKLLQTADLDD